VQAVELAGDRRLEIAHELGQVQVQRLQEHMEVVAHEHEREQAHVVLGRLPGQTPQDDAVDLYGRPKQEALLEATVGHEVKGIACFC
jgi:hypothetical protein